MSLSYLNDLTFQSILNDLTALSVEKIGMNNKNRGPLLDALSVKLTSEEVALEFTKRLLSQIQNQDGYDIVSEWAFLVKGIFPDAKDEKLRTFPFLAHTLFGIGRDFAVPVEEWINLFHESVALLNLYFEEDQPANLDVFYKIQCSDFARHLADRLEELRNDPKWAEQIKSREWC